MTQSVKIGILNDLSDGPPSPSDVAQWLQLALDELRADGRLQQPVELINAWGLGLPYGSAEAVEKAFHSLREQQVHLIVGPAIGDNALIVTPLSEQYRVPTLNWAGSEWARGEFMFHLQVGSHEDESIVLARYMASQGVKRVGVVFDESPIGERYWQFFAAEAPLLGIDVVAVETIEPLASEADHQLHTLLAAQPDALVYLGLGPAALPLARLLSASGWRGLMMMNTAGIRGHHAPEYAEALEGWMYLDMYSDHNVVLQRLVRRLNVAGNRWLAAAKGYDLGRLVAEGLARSKALTADGVRQGLEQIKWLPAAEGHDGVLLGFGHFDRGALHGPYLVLRQWHSLHSVQVA